MTKKSAQKKKMLGSKLKRSRRMPVLAVLRTHRRVQMNKFRRDWRHNKLDLKVD